MMCDVTHIFIFISLSKAAILLSAAIFNLVL